MANTSISNLTASGTLTGAEIVPIVQTGATVRTTTAAIAALASSGSGTVTSVAASVPGFLSIAGSPITTSGTLAITYSGTALPVLNGGTGTTTPALVAGTNVTITGTWPNQTINATGGGGGSGTVTSVSATVPGFLSVAGSPITSSGTLAFSLSGTALPVTSGGSGLTTLTLNRIPYGQNTSAYGNTDNLSYDGTTMRIGASALLGGAINPVLGITGAANNYIQGYMYNTTNGTSSSADFVAYASNSTDAHGWADMGFTSPTYADTVYTVTGPNEAYLLGSALNSTYTGNLVYATDSTGSANSHQWYVGGFTQAKSAWKMQLTSTDLQLSVPLNNPTIKNYTEAVVAIGTVTSSNTIALTNGTVQTATLTASTACTFTMPTATAGKSFILLLKQAATTGNGTATFTGVKWPANTAPTITATAATMDILSFVSDGTNWYGSVAQAYVP
ncbi:hypothetical protein UFOVP48_83 [uncultured Caudovirales phage]|uniref:Uncharacterized protein n=1 Tax=uncultured Caudovirales phage TaxID=2100421 RepID=A0A6J5KUA5_9CAUD|nr:hypothetical protein UFOVP48_83 [uncultured Caudovirales phage]